MNTEDDRLRRELRAMGAVNRQLQAQLDEPTAVVRQRRAGHGSDWIDKLVGKGVVDAALVQAPNGQMFVVEADQKRPVRAGIVGAALEEAFGRPRSVSNDEVAQWTDGVPVELFEAPEGAPFVVIGGTRRTVRGVPLPHPVSNRQASAFPEGPEVNVAAANVSRRRYREAMSPRFQVERVKAAMKRKGIAGTTKAAMHRARKLVG